MKGELSNLNPLYNRSHPIIPKILLGLEVHITLNSQKKIFNWENVYQGDISPNSQVGPWELGYLGVLPILNPEVIHLGLKLAVALKAKVSKVVLFDRKIYNYFDLILTVIWRTLHVFCSGDELNKLKYIDRLAEPIFEFRYCLKMK